MQQPCGSKIKQQTWALIAEPGASIEQTLQSECPGEITKIMIIIIELDKPLMLQRLLARAEKDDIIICTKMDRLGRNTADMIHIVDACYKKGIAIRFLENGLSTEGTMGKMVIQILAAVAEAERERTNDGRLVAMAAGVKFGRKPHQKSAIVRELISQNVPVKLAIEKTGISRATYFRIKKLTRNPTD